MIRRIMPLGRFGKLGIYPTLVIVGRVANIVMMLFFAAHFAQNSLGQFAAVQAAAAFVTTLLSFNMGAALNVSAASVGSATRANIVTSASALYTIAAICLSAVFVIAYPSHMGAQGYTQAALLVSLTANGIAQNVVGSALVGDGRLTEVGFSLSAPSLIALIATPQVDGDFNLFLNIYIAALSLSSFYLLFLAARNSSFHDLAHSIKFISDNGRRFFSFGAKTTVSSAAITYSIFLLQSSLVEHGGASENAIFAIGSQFFNVVLFLPSSFSPLLLRDFAAHPETAGKRSLILSGSVAALCVLGITSWWLIAPLVLVHLPSLYGKAQPAIIWAMIAASIVFMKSPSALFLQSRFKTLQEIYGAGGALIAISVSAFTIPMYTGVQASIVRTVAMGAYLLATLPTYISELRADPKSGTT